MARKAQTARVLGICASAVLTCSAVHAQQTSATAPFHLIEADIDGIQAEVRSGRLTCVRLVQAYLDRIAAYDQKGPTLNAIQTSIPAR